MRVRDRDRDLEIVAPFYSEAFLQMPGPVCHSPLGLPHARISRDVSRVHPSAGETKCCPWALDGEHTSLLHQARR